MSKDLKPAFNSRDVAIDKQCCEFLQRSDDVSVVFSVLNSDVACYVNVKCVAEWMYAVLPAAVHFILPVITSVILSTMK